MKTRGYYCEIEIEDLLEHLGGKEGLKNQARNADEAFDLMVEVESDLVSNLHLQYTEVGLVNNSDLIDWCDNNF